MPTSIYIETYCEDYIEKYKTNPEAINALCLNIVEVADPLLATCFHDEKNNKSFTTRKLELKKQFLSLRMTLLEDKYFDKMANVFFNACTRPFLLNDHRIRISKILCSKDSNNYWANQRNYDDIYENASKKEVKIDFNIETPLSFKIGDDFEYFPLPELFYKSLHKRWNSFSDIKFDDSFLNLLKDKINTNYFDIYTDKLNSTTINLIGCKGKVSYKIQNKATTDFIHYINTLSDFAYFSGVGIKTSLGMGQVSRLYKDNN